MIKAKVEYGLEGAFKVDTYDKNGNFVETTDWFSNFITATGLQYPTIYPFCDCFRYLTLGTSSVPSDGGSAGFPSSTTGCISPILFYYDSTWGGTPGQGPGIQSGMFIGYQGYETSACTTRMTPNGPIFYRAWAIPTGGNNVTMNYASDGVTPVLYINEFAVSPTDGTNPTGCYAFSRITRSLPLKQGYQAIVSYQLKVNIVNSQTTLLPAGIFNTGNANIDKDADMIGQWAGLSGYYQQVWCGLSVVDNYGVSITTKFGNGMEPYLTDFSNYVLYFSPDNAQFDVNPISGGALNPPDYPIGMISGTAWTSNGLMAPLSSANRTYFTRNAVWSNTRTLPITDNTIYTSPPQSDTSVPDAASCGLTPFNIRLGADNSDPTQARATALNTVNLHYYTGFIWDEYINKNFNYQSNYFVDATQETISYATPGSGGLQPNRDPVYGQTAIFSSRIFRLPMDMTIQGNTYAYRNKMISRKAIFAPANSLGFNTRFGSMVYAYQLPDDNAVENRYTFYPTIDTLFYDTSGQAMLQHYRLISGIYLTSRGKGVINANINIVPAGPNITRNINLKTIQGPIVNGNVTMSGWFNTLNSGNLFPGINVTTWGDTTFNGSGYVNGIGAVYGVTGNYLDSTKLWDIGIMGHYTGALYDNPTGQLYWPNVFGSPLQVVFTNIVFSGGTVGGIHPNNPNDSDAGIAVSGFQRPSGVLIHYDAIPVQGGGYGGTPTGYRLLPNNGNASIALDFAGDTYDIYPPGYGALPGFSFDNGLEVYLDIAWSSPCPGNVVNCNPPS